MILCCGNPDRGDDAIGPHVAALLESLGQPVTRVRGHALEILDAWSGESQVTIVDAVVTRGSPAGEIHTWNLQSMPPALVSGSASTHGWGIHEAIDLGRILGNLPASVEIIGVEALAFEPLTPLSPPVLAAVPHVMDWLLSRSRPN